MKNFVNKAHVEGRVYDLSRLEKKTSGPNSKNPGTSFIRGSIFIAPEDDCMNTVEVFFNYEAQNTSKGTPNENYTILAALIDGKLKTVMNSSIEEAAKVRWDGRISLNDYLPQGSEEMASTKRYQRGFLHNATTGLDANVKHRNVFETEMLITKVREIEENPDNGSPRKVVVGGYIFDSFSKTIMPVEYDVLSERGMAWFLDQDISSKKPLLDLVWGRVVSSTQGSTRVTENAWGDEEENLVNTSGSTRRTFVITGMKGEGQPFDDESTITVDEIKQMLAAREVYLAEEKSRTLAYRNNNVATSAITEEKYDF